MVALNIGALNYLPTLAIRPSEMNGLEKLPGPTKDRLQPIFLLAPWATSNGLNKSIDRIEKAFPNRPYFLDLDRDYRISNLESQSQSELRNLFSPLNSYDNWFRFISQFDNANPCLQFHNQNPMELQIQIRNIQSLNKPYCVRFELERFPANINEIIASLNAVGTADYVIVLDGGWVRDTQLLELRLHGIITESLNSIDANIPIVISCTSIPKEFTDIEGTENIGFGNRDLIRRLSRSTNRASLIYGDWGSTRPRQEGGGSKPKPRIDYPTRNSWLFARNKEEDWTFEDAAEAIVGSEEWRSGHGLGVWGEQMIEQTCINSAIGINTPQKNVASRVNIHLHRQAFYDVADITGLNLDEDWVD